MTASAPTLPLNQQMIAPVVRIAARCGKVITADSKLLDFGCGTGRHVYEFRNAGYQTFGVDLGDYLRLRSPDDKRWFARSTDPDVYRIPFQDESFDLIYSTQVLEHLRYYEPALKEMRRVLKRDGICIHIFPVKWRPLETHFRIPFGGAIKTFSYFNFWTHLGFKAPDAPPGLSAKAHARRYWEESRTNLHYLSLRELKFFAGMFFEKVEFMEREFVEAMADASTISRIAKTLMPLPLMETLYRHFHTKVMVLSGYNFYRPVWPIGWTPGQAL
jgi:SAM-dependent methyltransferase